jgi:hypothetical protein
MPQEMSASMLFATSIFLAQYMGETEVTMSRTADISETRHPDGHNRTFQARVVAQCIEHT